MLVFIPSKSFSSRVPSKNTRIFASSSLLEITINFFKKHFRSKDIIVSSDSKSILKIAENLNCTTHLRTGFACSSNATNFDVMRSWIKESNIKQQQILLAQPCQPIRLDKDLENISKLKMGNNYISVHSNKNFIVEKNSQPFTKSSLQKDDYVIDGTYYIIDSELIMSEAEPQFLPFIISDEIERIDINLPHDFVAAESLYKDLKK